MMDVHIYAILGLLVGAIVAETRDKRILLHSDIDIAQAIQDLKAEVSQLKTENGQLKTEIGQLQSSTTHYESTSAQLQNVTIQLQSKVSQLESENLIKKGSGTTYVRWGRTTCDANGTTLAYSGYMGGGSFHEYGAAVNYICLAANPVWGYYEDARLDSASKVYGVEYDFYFKRPDGAANFFGPNLANQDAPCAVCHSLRSATMMIPGRNQCYPGWTQEYSGYLVAGVHTFSAATEFICLDNRPEVVVGGGRDDNENVLHMVEGICGGSLECPPYVDGRELTCVVCTK